MKDRLLSLFKHHYAFIIFLSAYFVTFAHKLITKPTPFFDWDESIYVQVGKEMIERFSLVPLWQGEFWLDKPPLVPLFYGAVLKITPFVQPEISTRIATLLLSLVVLTFLYLFYNKIIKETLLTTLIVATISFTQIFLQRSQVPNIDAFLLLGWLGYVMFYKSFRWSLFFLTLSVLSKSLLGFYPVAIMFLYFVYLFITKQIDKKELFKEIKKMTIQASIMLLWYVIMFAFFGKSFWVQHIYETHFRRVASSIESHFGHRTYYIDILTEQYLGKPLYTSKPSGGIEVVKDVIIFFIAVLGGTIFTLYQRFKSKKIKDNQLLRSFYLMPWFIFLNVTKTKIHWYTYPGIPPFSFLLFYPLVLLKKNKYLYYTIILIIFMGVLNRFVGNKNIIASEYSKLEPHHQIAQTAKDQCTSLTVIVESDTRTTFSTLRDMNLLITTSTWWGNHPSMVYYFEKKIDYVYFLDNIDGKLKSIPKGSCVSLHKNDTSISKEIQQLKLINQFGELQLYKRL